MSLWQRRDRFSKHVRKIAAITLYIVIIAAMKAAFNRREQARMPVNFQQKQERRGRRVEAAIAPRA